MKIVITVVACLLVNSITLVGPSIIFNCIFVEQTVSLSLHYLKMSLTTCVIINKLLLKKVFGKKVKKSKKVL